MARCIGGRDSKISEWENMTNCSWYAWGHAKASIRLVHGFRRKTKTRGIYGDETFQFCGRRVRGDLQSSLQCNEHKHVSRHNAEHDHRVNQWSAPREDKVAHRLFSCGDQEG